VQGGYAPYKVIGYNERYTNVDVVKNTGELKIE